MDPRVERSLRTVFGYDGLRDGQAQAVAATLAGRDVLVVMPTGSGKSLCYQLPALHHPGLTVVVAPLVALMQDQVHHLRARGIPAGLLHAGQVPAEAALTLRQALAGQLRLLYVSPERLAGAALRATLAGTPVARVVVDEAHCLLHWGHDFRPDYLGLAAGLAALGEPPVTALTATATEAEQAAILVALGRPSAMRVVTGFDRPEIYLAAQRVASAGERLRRVLAVLRHADGAALVYVASRGDAEQVANCLADHHGLAAAAYHAGLPTGVRLATQAAFMANRLQVLVATSAFGLGVDKADIRAVVQWSLPFDLSAFYQAVGRAARDGQAGLGLLLFGPEDLVRRRWQIAGVTPSTTDLALLCAVLAAPGQPEGAVTEAVLADASGLALPKVRAAAAALCRQHIVRRAGAGCWAALRPPRAGELAWLAGQADVRRREREHQLERMANYATGSGCRRRTLLAHFGASPERVPGPCCDRCGPAPSPAPRPRGSPGGAGEPANAEAHVLATIAARDGRLTARGVALVLRDAQVSAAAVRAAVDRLVAGGCLAVHHADGHPRLALTRRGRARLAAPAARPG